MTGFLGLLLSRWTISLLGTLLLAALVWVFGPLLPALQEPTLRVVLVVVMLLIWAVANMAVELLRRGRETALASGLTSSAVEEAAAVREKLTTALQLLKKRRGARGFLYEQPWYAIIGPPGAGKTTALLNAGLNFPLAAEMGKGALAGVGGTRLCEWWFTEQAVLIDTAGRYTTQDSNESVDRAGWSAFLDLLHRTRPRQPLNGVIVAIALSDIARAPAAERLGHARAIRQRVRELETRLGARMPVYALLTKADLIAGFMQFFDDLDETGRAQVWGTTFPLETGGDGSVAGFPPEFRTLLERLDVRLFERLQAEQSVDRRAQIAMFPSQVATLEQPLTSFLSDAFGPSGGEGALMLRGVYFTSGTQEGTPIDRLLGTMARSFGLDQRGIPSMRPDQGRSYFLNGLLRNVIFNEAMLTARNPRAERRRKVLRIAGFASAAVVVLAAGIALWSLRGSEQLQIATAEAALSVYEEAAGKLTLDPVADADLPKLLPLLDEARVLADKQAAAAATLPQWWELGLSQQVKLAAAAHEVYRHALTHALLPRLLWRLEAQMRGNLNQPDFLYEATRVYLMLGGAGPLDRDLVDAWMQIDWLSSYPGEDQAPVREALQHHLEALLADPLPSVAVDGALVVQARRAFANVPLAQRAYSRLRPYAAAQHIPPWRPSDVLGPAGVGLFVRASGKPLSDPIPGLYTAEGFRKAVLPELETAAHDIVSETWVLGQRVDLDAQQMRDLQQQILALYVSDYIRMWDGLLTDLNFIQMRSLPRAAQDLYIVASPQSPLRAMLISLGQQLRAASLAGSTTQVTPKPVSGNNAAEQLQALLGSTTPANAAALVPGHEIDQHFQPLLAFVGDGPGAPMDQAIKSLVDLQQLTAKIAAQPVGTALPTLSPENNPAVALQVAAPRLPQPVQRWFGTMASSGAALLGGNARDQVAAVFNAPGGPASVCAAAVKGHYPFTRDASADLSLEDFAKVFAPGGVIDGFVNTMLRPYVDMSASPWKPQTADGVAAPVNANELAQFQRAAQIRDAFFAGGGTSPSIRFDITPTALDKTSQQATLDIDGTAVTATHGAPRALEMTWPSGAQTSAARLSFDPPPAGAAPQDNGPWAMLRLFGRAKLKPLTGPDRYALTFQSGGREATFELRSTSSVNPFTPNLLQDFRCPTVGGS
jgi:type VI secretion system protein ImpL